MKVGFESIANYLPGEKLNVRKNYKYLDEEIAKFPKEKQAEIYKHAPINVRRLRDISAAEIMSLFAAHKALDKAGLTPDDMDGMLVCQQGGKQFMPCLGTYLHLNLGLKRNCIVRNVNDEGNSFNDAINIAWNYVESGLCRRVLVVSATAVIGGQVQFGVDLTEALSMNYGDGAGAVIVSAENLLCEIVGYHFESEAVRGRAGGTLIANFGAPRPPHNSLLCPFAFMQDKWGAYMELEDPTFDKVVGKKGYCAGVVGRAVEKAGLKLQDINTMIGNHIGNKEGIWKQDLIDAGMNAGVFKSKKDEYGYMCASDIPVDLADFYEEGRFTADDIVALWSICYGVQTAVILLRWM